jgi:hypothetical protein
MLGHCAERSDETIHAAPAIAVLAVKVKPLRGR